MELLRLEITESAFTESTEQIVSSIHKLIGFGFEVEIDDFGSGYSSLNTLKDVPATILKLDMRFLEGSDNNQRGGNILQSVVRMSKWLGMSVIAEGVETKEHADYLKSIGCTYVQGYYYARPMPQADYEKLVSAFDKRESMLKLETVSTLDNNSFWDPQSMDTLIFNSYVGGACIFEYAEGKSELLRVNDKFLEIYGSDISNDSVFSSSIMDHMSQEGKGAFLDCIGRAIETGGEAVCEVVVMGRYGIAKALHIRLTLRVIARSGVRYLVYASVLNVTEQREAEQKERKLTTQLHMIMDNIDGGVTAIVMDNEHPRLLFASERFYKQLGYTKAQFDAEVAEVFDRIHPEDQPRVLSDAMRINRHHRKRAIAYRAVRRDGSICWMRSIVSVAALPGEEAPVQVAVAMDVTDEIENELKMNELINAIPGGVAIYRVGRRVETLYSSDGMAKLTDAAPYDVRKKVLLLL